MQKKIYKEMTAEELVKQAEELRKEKFTLRAQARIGQMKNPAKMKQTRRDLARVLTEITARDAK